MADDPYDGDLLQEGTGALSSYLGDQNRAFQTGMQGYGGALDYLRGHPYQSQQQGMLALASGLLAPTKSGGWAESFGRGAGNLQKANDVGYQAEMDRNLKMADLTSLQSKLYAQRGNAQLNAFQQKLAIPGQAAAAQESVLGYRALRNGESLLPSMPTFTPPPVSQVPVDPATPPSPAPSPAPGPQAQADPVAPDATTARASLRTPAFDVAGDYAGSATRPATRAMRLPPGLDDRPVAQPAPEMQPGDYPSATGLPRTPGAPNYNWQTPKPDESQHVRPGVHQPGAIITENEPVLDDSGRPLDPTSLAGGAATTATDAPTPETAAAGRVPPQTPPAATAAAQTAPTTAQPTPPVAAAAGQPAPAQPAPVQAPAPPKVPMSGSYEETGNRNAPSQAQIDWAHSVQQQIAAKPYLGSLKMVQTQAAMADKILTQSEKALTDWRNGQAAAHESQRLDLLAQTGARDAETAARKAYYESPQGIIEQENARSAAKRSNDDIDGARAGAKQATDTLPKIDNLERMYDDVQHNSKIAPGPIKGRFAQAFGIEGTQALDAASTALRDVHAAGVGSVSNLEQGIIASTTAGGLDNPKDFKLKIGVLRIVNQRKQQYNRFLQEYAKNHGNSTDGAQERWEDFMNANPVITQDQKGQTKFIPENVSNWKGFAYDKASTPADVERLRAAGAKKFVAPDGNVYEVPPRGQ